MAEFFCTTCKEPLTPNDRQCPRCRRPAVLLGRYWLQGEKLGQGGFGVVYEARDLKLSLRCAVKELPRQRGDDERTRGEVDALVAISNEGLPFVPKIYDYDDQDPHCYYI